MRLAYRSEEHVNVFPVLIRQIVGCVDPTSSAISASVLPVACAIFSTTVFGVSMRSPIYTNVCGSQYTNGSRFANGYSYVHSLGMETIGQILDAAMKRRTLDQPSLERLSGVSQATISRTLEDETIPSTKTIAGLASALDKEFSDQLSKLLGTRISPQEQRSNVTKMSRRKRALVQELCDLAERINDIGVARLVGNAEVLIDQYPIAKKRKAVR